jgi:hypothetical protein
MSSLLFTTRIGAGSDEWLIVSSTSHTSPVSCACALAIAVLESVRT